MLALLAASGFVLISSSPTTVPLTTAVFAQEGSSNNNTDTATITTDEDTTATTSNTTTTTAPPSELELSPNPIYQERTRITSETPINQTHVVHTYSGNGSLTLPDTGETINTVSNGNALVSLMTQSAQGEETFQAAEDSNETATATFYEFIHLSPDTGEVKGILIAEIHTDSTGIFAPLDGTIAVGIDNIQPSGEGSVITMWEWQRGTPLPSSSTIMDMAESPPMMNATTPLQ